MIKLMYETQCYINVVGDKLQSLEYTNNFLTEIVDEGLPNIDIDKKEAINKNRRIKVTNMGDKINELIDFSKFNLPYIECDKEIEKDVNLKPIITFKSPNIYSNDPDSNKIDKYCKEIIEKYKNEVEKHNYLPKDFLIIFPIMKNNIMASELQSRIQEYWVNKYNNEYTQYVYLHKHTEGKVINTNDSVNATRIMSIRSSKGDGRKVVFVLGITEDSLKRVSNKEIGLVYESYLHVALTRAKNQIYFALIENNDDIHKRFGNKGYVKYLPNISKKIQIEKICELINQDNLIKLLEQNNISLDNIIKEENKIKQSKTVDWGYHCIKTQTFYYQVILNIIKNKDINDKYDKSHLLVTLRKISNYPIIDLEVNDYYEFLNKYQYSKDKDNKMSEFPLCKLSDKHEYIKYYNKIKKTLKKVQQKLKTNKLNELNVYESILLTYMIQIYTCGKFADMTPMDIYNITHFFESNNNKEKDLLNNLKNIKDIINESKIVYYENINWNVFKHIEMYYELDDFFKISKLQFPIIGNNKTDIVHIVLKPDISQLNFWDIMIEILLERFLIYNPKNDKDIQKFKDKNIHTYLFLLDRNSFIKIEWNWDKKLINEIKTELKSTLENYFKSYHNDICKYIEFIKNNEKEEWNTKPDKIIKKLLEKFKNMYNCPYYITNTFDDIYEEEEYDSINDDYLNDKLNKNLKKKLKRYFDFK